MIALRLTLSASPCSPSSLKSLDDKIPINPLPPGFSLHINHEVDILFVIDNSPGSPPSQAALARAIDEMLDALSSVHNDGDRSLVPMVSRPFGTIPTPPRSRVS